MSTLNKNIENTLKYADSKVASKTSLLSKNGKVFRYWENKNTIEWDDLCDFVNNRVSSVSPCKSAIGMLVYYLENGLYEGKHKTKLLKDLPYLKKSVESFNKSYKLIFQKNYDEIQFIHTANTDGTCKQTVTNLYNCNNFFGSLFVEYLGQSKCGWYHESVDQNYGFMYSVKDLEISSLADVDSSVFWHQVNYFKKCYENDDMKKDYSLRTLCRFYRWLLSAYPEHEFFTNSTNLTYELVFSNSLVKHIKNDAYFTTFTSTEDLGDKPRIVFIVKNLQNKSTIMVKNSHFVLYTDKLESSFYREIVNKYVQNATSTSMLSSGSYINHIVDILHVIEQVKAHQEYPNPSLANFNTREAMAIRDYIKLSKTALPSMNNKIGAIRRFLQWAKGCGYATFDSTFFDYLSQYEEPNQYRGNAISDSDIEKISKTFIELCDEDLNYKPYYAIFLILIETEFRVSQVCNLTVSSLQPTLKSDQFLLYSNTKTSNGKKVTQPICKSTKKILDTVIEESEALRNEVLSDSYKDHIFLYKTKYIQNPVKGINSSKFLTIFRKVCEKAGTRLYDSRNLRDTHMTKAFEYIMRHGKSDLEMGVLSRHTRIDTTKNHYIEIELTKMLESTYQITLGNRDINQQSHILDTLPDKLSKDDTLVEGGCGHCKAKTCKMTGSLPCLICKDFVTTVDRKPYFIKMISYIDIQLERAIIRHEIEDLTLIKTLYINWLREICLKEEENNASTNSN